MRLRRPNATSTSPCAISSCDTTVLHTTVSTSSANVSIHSRSNLNRSRQLRRKAGRSRRTSLSTLSSVTRPRSSRRLRDAYSSGGACGTSSGSCCITERIHSSRYWSRRGPSRRGIILRLFKGFGVRSRRVCRVCRLSRWGAVYLVRNPSLERVFGFCNALC